MTTDMDDLSTMTMPLLEFCIPKGEMYALRSGNKAKLQSHGTGLCFCLASSLVLQDWGSTSCFCWRSRVFTFSTSHGNITSFRVVWPCPISNTIWPHFRLLQTVRTATHRHLTLHQSSRAMFLLIVQQSNKTFKNLRLFWCRCFRYGFVLFLHFSYYFSFPYTQRTVLSELSNRCCWLAVPTAAYSKVSVHSTYF